MKKINLEKQINVGEIMSRSRRLLPLDIILDLGPRSVMCFLYIVLLNDVFASWTQGEQSYRAPTYDSKSSIAHSKLEAVAQDPEISCTSDDYHTQNLGCDEGWHPIGLGCFKLFWEKLNWGGAKKKCTDENAYLAKFDYQQHVLFFGQVYKNPNAWIGMRVAQPTRNKNMFKWLDGTVPAYDFWGPGQPTGKRGSWEIVAALHNWGFFDYAEYSRHWVLCRKDTISSAYADKYIKEEWKIKNLTENEQDFVFGTKFNIRCEGYYRDGGEAPFVKMENRDGNTESTTTRIFLEAYPTASVYENRMRILMKSTIPERMEPLISSRNEINVRYFKHQGLCIRKSLPYVEFEVHELLARRRFRCCKLFNDHETDCSSGWVDTPKIKYLARKPMLSIHPNRTGNVFGVGEEATCRCFAATGAMSVVLGAVVTHAGCGNWTVTLDGTRKKEDKHGVPKDCGIQVENIKTTGIMYRYGGRSTTFDVRMRVIEAFHGAACLCYSYNASRRAEMRNFIDPDDHLQSTSGPFRVVGAPILRVVYHEEPNIVYRGEILEATCSASLATGVAQARLVLHAQGRSYPFDLDSGVSDSAQYLPGGGSVRIQEKIVNIRCPRGWFIYSDTENCVWASTHALNWEEARQHCKHMNADLVVIRDHLTNDFIKDLLNEDGYWIGLSDRKSEGVYMWLDGPEKASYVNWNRNFSESTFSDQNCIYTAQGEWESLECNQALQFICQMPSGVPPTLATSTDTIENSSLVEYEDYGPFAINKLTMKVIDSVNNASLECFSILNHPRYKMTEKSHALKVQYGPQPSDMTLTETAINGQKAVKMRCSALVGDGGVLSFAVVLGNSIRHLYIINTTAGVTEEKPSPHLTIDNITVSEVEDKGPSIEVEVIMILTTELRKASIFCDSLKLGMDSTVPQDRLMKVFTPKGGDQQQNDNITRQADTACSSCEASRGRMNSLLGLLIAFALAAAIFAFLLTLENRDSSQEEEKTAATSRENRIPSSEEKSGGWEAMLSGGEPYQSSSSHSYSHDMSNAEALDEIHDEEEPQDYFPEDHDEQLEDEV